MNAALAGGASTLDAVGTILDDDVPRVTVSFGSSSYRVAEGDLVRIPVRLDRDPERSLSIPLVPAGRGGGGSADYAGVPASAGFAAGVTQVRFAFAATDDSADDDGESVAIAFGALPAEPGFYRVRLTVGGVGREVVAEEVFLVESGDPVGRCALDERTACLGQARYRVTAAIMAPGGDSVDALVVREGTNDTALFRFFSPSNWELLVKVLDGCEEDGHAWVFAASTTDLGFVLRVEDTVTGDVKVYPNESGRAATAITDVAAFPSGCAAN